MISKKTRFVLLLFITTQICACHPDFFKNIQPQESYQPSASEVESLRQVIYSLRKKIKKIGKENKNLEKENKEIKKMLNEKDERIARITLD